MSVYVVAAAEHQCVGVLHAPNLEPPLQGAYLAIRVPAGMFALQAVQELAAGLPGLREKPVAQLAVHRGEWVRASADRPRLDWKLVTDLPITSHEAALETLRWYAMRWKIEVFHKILKSGCKAEDARLRTAERLSRLIAVFCILSWRVFVRLR